MFFLSFMLGIASVPPEPGYLDVASFGAKGDGKTDDSKAFQAALNSAGDRHLNVFAGSGNYLFRHSIKAPSGVTLKGSWESVPSRWRNDLPSRNRRWSRRWSVPDARHELNRQRRRVLLSDAGSGGGSHALSLDHRHAR